jgi:Flp pilus assembly protein CpaB
MRRGRVFFILAFVLILGLVGVLIVWRFFLNRQTTPEVVATPTPPPVEIVLIAQPVARGTTLDPSMLVPASWPQDKVTPGMIEAVNLDEYIGRVVKYDLPPEIPLLENMLLTEGEQIPTAGSPWALNIPAGMVAVSVPVDRLAVVAYAPRPGDHVNVIASMMFVDVDTDFQSISPSFTGSVISSGPPDPETKTALPLTVGIGSLGPQGAVDPSTGRPAPPSPLNPGIYGKVVIDPVLGQAVYVVPSESQRARIASQVLIQDAVVLEIGNFPLPGTENQGGTPTPTPEPGQEGQQAPPAPPAPPDVITLIVRPQDAVALNYLMLAQSQLAARLSLVLRNSNDQSRENVLPVTLQFLLEQYQIPVPAKLPYSLNPRMDTLQPPK